MPRIVNSVVCALTVLLIFSTCSGPNIANGQIIPKIHHSLLDPFFDPFEPLLPHFDVTVLGVGCTPIQTLHKSVQHGNNETVVTMTVSQSCAPAGKVALKDLNITVVPDAGEVRVRALIDGKEKDALAQRITLDPRADVDNITASYDEGSRSLKVIIPHKHGVQRQIPVHFIARDANKAASSHTDVTAGDDHSSSPSLPAHQHTDEAHAEEGRRFVKATDRSHHEESTKHTGGINPVEEALTGKIKALEAELAKARSRQ